MLREHCVGKILAFPCILAGYGTVQTVTICNDIVALCLVSLSSNEPGHRFLSRYVSFRFETGSETVS